MTNCPNYATFIQRAERVEEAERMDSNSNTSTSASVPKKNKSSKSSNGKGKSYIRNEDSPSGNGTKNCIYHGMNNTHSTDECKVMQAMAKSKKSSSGNTNRPTLLLTLIRKRAMVSRTTSPLPKRKSMPW